MSFGFGVGDFAAAVELVNKIRRDFAGAPKEYEAISCEVKNLSNVFRDLDDISDAYRLTDLQKSDLQCLCDSLKPLLVDLIALDAKYVILETESGTTVKPLSQKLRRTWKRLRWEPDDARDLRSRITSNIVLLESFKNRLVNDTLRATNVIVRDLADNQHAEKRLVIADWISPAQYAVKHRDVLDQRQHGTGSWFFGSHEYLAICDGRLDASPLLCHGIPGAGKTIIAASAIEDLRNSFGPDPNIAVIYVYNDYKVKQNFPALMLMLLRQLFEQRDAIDPDVALCYNKHIQNSDRPGTDTICDLLGIVMGKFERVFLVVDALDEITNEPNLSISSRDRFVSELVHLQSQHSSCLKLLVTSRQIPEIMNAFRPCKDMEIRAPDQDIDAFLNGQIVGLKVRIRQQAELVHDIKSCIIKAADGMFLLARFHFESIRTKSTPAAVRKALRDIQDLPRGPKALKVAYDDTMHRIKSQDENSSELALRLLSWIVYAHRPLRVEELIHGFSVKPGDRIVDPNNFEDPEDLISVCGGLAMIDPGSETFRLVHYSTQEYFQHEGKEHLQDGDLELWTACLAYLQLDELYQLLGQVCSNHSLTWMENHALIMEKLKAHPFSHYACVKWALHLRKLPITIVRDLVAIPCDILCHLDTCKGLEASEAALGGLYNRAAACSNSNIGHLLAKHNLTGLLRYHLGNGGSARAFDDKGRTALNIAAALGHQETVTMLLEQPDIDINAQDILGSTALLAALESGRENCALALLAHNDTRADIKDHRGNLPLHYCARDNEIAAALRLVSRPDVRIDAPDGQGRTASYWAFEMGDVELSKVLAKNGALFNPFPVPNMASVEHLNHVKALTKFLTEENSRDKERSLVDVEVVAVNSVKIAQYVQQLCNGVYAPIPQIKQKAVNVAFVGVFETAFRYHPGNPAWSPEATSNTLRILLDLGADLTLEIPVEIVRGWYESGKWAERMRRNANSDTRIRRYFSARNDIDIGLGGDGGSKELFGDSETGIRDWLQMEDASPRPKWDFYNNKLDDHPVTALEIAVGMNEYGVVKRLVDYGAPVEECISWCRSAGVLKWADLLNFWAVNRAKRAAKGVQSTKPVNDEEKSS